MLCRYCKDCVCPCFCYTQIDGTRIDWSARKPSPEFFTKLLGAVRATFPGMAYERHKVQATLDRLTCEAGEAHGYRLTHRFDGCVLHVELRDPNGFLTSFEAQLPRIQRVDVP